MKHPETSVELAAIRKSPALFAWGKIVKIHDIGPYSVVEYLEWEVEGCTLKVGQPSTTTAFSPYCNNDRLGTSWSSLEAALLHAFSFKAGNGGTTGAAVYYAMRVLGLNTDK